MSKVNVVKETRFTVCGLDRDDMNQIRTGLRLVSDHMVTKERRDKNKELMDVFK